MQETRKKNGGNEDSKKKERHIVTWTQEEDDILRGQISLHGTVKLLNMGSKQMTYGELQAQKVFGNRWTEIAKNG
ncbi:myb-like protein Q isoform X1 [Gossypium australe]|uniref:Myb-like protein Q isoform X1 n=1 Tax=Gossypium australe TaxID=47621 RepID=A0A5B6X527_9ROSI|nr:myb-like protein Q isoform X1 [Gossypium australe]